LRKNYVKTFFFSSTTRLLFALSHHHHNHQVKTLDGKFLWFLYFLLIMMAFFNENVKCLSITEYMFWTPNNIVYTQHKIQSFTFHFSIHDVVRCKKQEEKIELRLLTCNFWRYFCSEHLINICHRELLSSRLVVVIFITQISYIWNTHSTAVWQYFMKG
jgi:hypothetical protein